LIAEGKEILRFASGAVHQTTYFPEVKAFHICYPPLSEQQRNEVDNNGKFVDNVKQVSLIETDPISCNLRSFCSLRSSLRFC